MAAGVVILAVLAEPISGWRVTRRQWWGVGLGAGGLALLAIVLPTIHGAHNAFSAVPMIGFEVVSSAIGLALLLPRLRRLGAHDGALIGAVSGVFFAVADLAVKALVGAAHAGPLAVLGSPWLLVAVAAGLMAQYVSARSLQTGDGVSVTAMTGVAVNVLNIAGGILVFGDPLATGLAGTMAEAAAFACICRRLPDAGGRATEPACRHRGDPDHDATRCSSCEDAGGLPSRRSSRTPVCQRPRDLLNGPRIERAP